MILKWTFNYCWSCLLYGYECLFIP